MRKITNLSAIALLGTVALGGAAAAHATDVAGIQVPLIEVNTPGFGDSANTSSRLIRMTPRIGAEDAALYVVTTNENGIQLWKSTTNVAREWEQVSNAALTEDSTNVSVVDVAIMDSKLYVLVNSSDGFEVWQWSEDSDWTNVYEQHGSNTVASMMKKAGDKLYVGEYSTSTGLAQLYASTDGSTWSTVGDAGLSADSQVARVNDVAEFKGDFYAFTSDGRVLRSTDSGSTYSVVYTSSLSGADFLVARKHNGILYFGGSSDSGALLMATSNGSDFTTVTEDGFGNTQNTAVTEIKEKHGRVQAYMENGSGFEMYRMTHVRDNATWELWIDAGANDADNTAVADVVSYHGHRYISTKNSTDGTEVILYQFRAPRVHITSPMVGSSYAVGDITFTGTAQAGNRVDIRRHHVTLGSTVADSDGNWSITIHVTDKGHDVFHVYAQYLDEDGNAMGQISLSRAVAIRVY